MVSGAHHNNVTGCLHWRGDISYPIYLIHVGMIFAIDALGGRGWQALLSNIVMCSVAAARSLALVRTGTLLPIACFKSAFSRYSGLSSGL